MPQGENLTWRVATLERDIEKFEKYPAKQLVLEERIGNLTIEVKSLKRAFYTFAFSVVSGSVIFALSVLALVARAG